MDHSDAQITGGLRDFEVPPDDFQRKLKQFYAQRADFISTELDQLQLETHDNEIQSVLEEKSYVAMKSFADIMRVNLNDPPIVGSFVQCISDPLTHKTIMGIVIRGAISKFNESYNKLTVLTTDNEWIQLSTSDVVFHCHGVVDSEWLESLKILDQREDKFLYSRKIVLDVLRCFSNRVLHYATHVNTSRVLETTYAKHSSEYSMTGVPLTDVMFDIGSDPQLAASINRSYFDQSAALMAAHCCMASDPLMFIVPDLVVSQRATNLVQENSTNNLVKSPVYLLQPRSLSASITHVLTELEAPSSTLVNKLKFDISYLEKNQVSDQSKVGPELYRFLQSTDRGQMLHYFNVLKFWLVYPHPVLTRALEKLDFFDLTRDNVFRFLKRTKIFDNGDLTDITLSANLWSKSPTPMMSYTSPSQLSHVMNEDNAQQPLDSFKHLRGEKSYYDDNIIYGIPVGKHRVVGVSLQKLNTRNYLINVHIPDLVTELRPNSAIFKKLSKMPLFMRSLENLVNGDNIEIFSDEFIQSLQIHENLADQSQFSLDQGFKSGPVTPKPDNRKTCMTMTFNFNTHDSNPFESLKDKVEFSFDNISFVQSKSLSSDELEELIKGNRTSSLPFKLFRSRDQHEKQRLSNEDYHNIGFIYNVLKTHFSIRSINGSVDVAGQADGYTNSSTIEVGEQISMSLETGPKSEFFLDELNKFVGNMTAEYCCQREIPIISHGQDLLQSSEEDIDPNMDQVIVHHDNILLPNFYVNSFFQTLISRNANGHVSIPAYLIATNFLSKKTTAIGPTKNVPFGLKNGYVSMLDPLGRFDSLLNQLQILSSKHLDYQTSQLLTLKPTRTSLSKKMAQFKGKGYNINGPTSAAILQTYLNKLQVSSDIVTFLSSRIKRYWTLRFLEQRLLQPEDLEHTEYTTVVTSVGPVNVHLGARVSRAYVQELQLEVDVVTEPGRTLKIGAVVKCDRVVHLDVLAGECVLHEAPIF